MKVALVFGACLISSFAVSQPLVSGVVTGKIVDRKTKVPIEFVTVNLLNRDSTFVTRTLSDKTGTFIIKDQALGPYVLRLTIIGFKTIGRPITIRGLNVPLTFEMDEGIALNEVQILGEKVPIAIKGDTVEFNAPSYKTTPDAMVEDLLKKLPGMAVDRSGNVTSNGENISKVTVEGRDFFGTDPKMATRNLPADAISKVQLVEERSEESKAKGVDDGTRLKTLNLILKEDKKSGWFGNAAIAGGSEDRYHVSASANHFNKDKQLNFLLLSNNISQGFTSEDASNFTGNNYGTTTYYSSGGGSPSQPSQMGGVNIGKSSGLNNTSSGGLNFSDTWGKKNTIRFSGSYNSYLTSTLIITNTDVQKIQPTGTFFNTSVSNADNSTQSHRFNVRLTAAIDKSTNLTFAPSLTLGMGSSAMRFISSEMNNTGSKLNDYSRDTQGDSFTPSLNGSFSISRTFKERKGSLSMNVYNFSSGSSTDNTNQSSYNYYQGRQDQTFNRLESAGYENGTLNASITLTKTIRGLKNTSLLLAPSFGINTNDNDRNTLEYNPLNGTYELRVDSLSNSARSKTRRYGSGFGFSKNSAKLFINGTANLQAIVFDGNITNKVNNENIKRNYWTIVPQMSVTYRQSPRRSFMLNTSGSLNPPSITYLQTRQNNPSPLFISEGNVDLKPELRYNSSIRYTSSNPTKNTFSNFSLNYMKVFNATTLSRDFDVLTGVTRSKPINVDGNYNVNVNGSVGVPTKLKGLRVSPGISALTSRNVGLINGLKNNTDRLNAGLTLNVSYAYKESINITFVGRNAYEYASNSAGRTINTRYFNLSNSVNIAFEPIKTWRISADVVQESYSNRNVLLFNPGIRKFFMEKRQLSLEFTGFDILNQNSDINRFIYDNQIVDTQVNNVSRYFYMKVFYKINKLSPQRRTFP